MARSWTKNVSLLRVALSVLSGILSLVILSYVNGRRQANRRVALLPENVQFYRQMFLVHYASPKTTWSGPAWEVRYQGDVLSGFTRDVRVSLFGRVIDCNFSDQIRGGGCQHILPQKKSLNPILRPESPVIILPP